MEKVLLLYFIIMLLLSYHFIDKNILHPNNLYFIGCISSCAALIYGNNVWQVAFDIKTTWIYVLGSGMFFVISLIFSYFFKGKSNSEQVCAEPKCILINRNILYICIIFQCAVLVAFCVFLFNEVSGDAISVLLHAYRKGRKAGAIELPFLLGQSIKTCWALASIQVYILAHNIVATSKSGLKKFKGNKIYLVGITIFIVQQLLQASRMYILLLIIQFVFLYLFFRHKYIEKKKVLSLKESIKLCLILVLTLYFFVYAGQLIGRTNADNYSPLHYFASYAGSTMQIFNIYVKGGTVDISLFGHGTFYTFDGFDSLFNYLGVERTLLSQTKQYVSANGVILGNICANYFYWLYDFGILGVIGFSSIMSMVFNFFYKKIMQEFRTGKVMLMTLYYSCIVYALIMNGIADYFYRSILSVNYFSMFILSAIIVKVIFKIKFV